jgi:hypothetical protein
MLALQVGFVAAACAGLLCMKIAQRLKKRILVALSLLPRNELLLAFPQC